MRRLANIPGITFALYLAWKVALLVFTAQPVPSNDSFFYDGPVVNQLLHGKYCNPPLAMVLPISGKEVFSAYPPLYQAVLLGWMKCFGTSALAAMWLQVTLLGAFSITALLLLRQLRASPTAVNLAGLFLFGITFHDRPDTLAHLLGALAMLAVVRGLFWPVAAFLLLTFATSLQIGGIYSLWVGLLVISATRLQRIRFPWGAALALAGTLAALIALVEFGHPQLWAGFQEHVRITPSVTGLRLPRLDDLLKVARTAPGILIVATVLTWLMVNRSIRREQLEHSPALLVSLCGTLTAVALMAGCLLTLAPNTIHIAGYLQPVIVGGFLAGMGGIAKSPPRGTYLAPLAAAVLLVSLRAIGQTTWGVVCARDVGQEAARTAVRAALEATTRSSTVFVSAAYLYEAARHTNVTSLHSDWPAPATEPQWELRALENLRPAKLLLTQFDYYRRYAPVVRAFQQAHPDVETRITNLAHVHPPDASRSLQKVVQHISWAPVIVEFSWPPTGEPK